jgi:hypothetical protein
MSDSLEAAIHLSLKDEVSAALRKIAEDVLGLHGHFDKLQGQLSGIASGLAKIGAASGMAILIADTVKANAALERQVNIFRLAGNTAAEAAEARKAAYKSAVEVRGVDVVEQMKLLRELSSALQDNPGARDVLPDFARAKSVISFATGRDNDEDTTRLAKMIELRGGAVNRETEKIDPKLFQSELDAAVKALVVGQGLLTTNDLQQMIKQGGPAMKNFHGHAETFWADYLAAAEDMGGSRAGTATTAIARQILGGIMTPNVKSEWEKLGMLNATGWHHDKKGNVVIDDPAKAIHGYDDFLHGGVKDFVDKDMRPAFKKHGIDTPEKQNAELYQFGSTETARRMYGLYLSNDPQIKAVIERYKKAMGLDGFDKVVNHDFTHNLESVGAALHTFATALGSISDWINRLAKKTSDHPEIATGVTWSSAAALGVAGWGAIQIGKTLMGGFGLSTAASQLTGAAVALDGAAAKLGGASMLAGGLPGASAKSSVIGAGQRLPLFINMGSLLFNMPDMGDNIKPDAHGEWGIAATVNGWMDKHLPNWMSHAQGTPTTVGPDGKGGILSGIGSFFGNIGSAFTSDVQKLPGQVDPAIHGAIGSIGAKLAAAISTLGNTAAAIKGPPVIKQASVTVNHTTKIDGRVLARSTSQHLARLFEHPTSAPAHDNYRGYIGPDAQTVTT